MSGLDIILLWPSALPEVVQDIHAAVIIEAVLLGSEVRSIWILVGLACCEEIFARHKAVNDLRLL